MLFKRQDNIGTYTVMFPHTQGACTETYRVVDADGVKRFLKLVNRARLKSWQTDRNGQIIETSIFRRLSHNNICAYVDDGEIIRNGRKYAYIVQEYVSGATLVQSMAEGVDFTVYKVKKIAKAVLSALGYLHELSHPVIHNAVEAQNVMLNYRTDELSDLKLIGFSHVCRLDAPVCKQDFDDLNVFYLAPERFTGDYSVQSDLYSVGVLMYHLLFGCLPWFVDLSRVNEKERVDYLLSERNKPLEIPDMDIFELDGQLLNTMKKAMQQDPEDRFQSASDFIKAIDGDVKVDDPDVVRKIKSGEGKAMDLKSRKAAGEGFAAIAGMQELKDILQKEVIDALHNSEEYARYGLTIPNGMLLYGPPGCGKTFFAKHFAEEVGFNFMDVKPSTLQSRYVNATQENIAKMFKDAEEKAPTIIFIDEINELLPNRDSNVHEMYRSAVNEMLAQMDRTGEKGVFVIGATNYPNMIDPAMLRAGRLDKKYYVGPPDKAAREKMFMLYLEKRPYDFGLDYGRLADLTENYVSADIKLIVDDASREALIGRSKITMQILESVISMTEPSLTKAQLEKFDAIRADFDSANTSGKSGKRPRIGFT